MGERASASSHEPDSGKSAPRTMSRAKRAQMLAESAIDSAIKVKENAPDLLRRALNWLPVDIVITGDY